MFNWFGNRLRDDVLWRVLLPMAVVLLISGLIGYAQASKFVYESYDNSLLEEARGLAQQVHIDGKTIYLDMPAAAADILRSDSNDQVYFQVRVIGGSVVAGDELLPEPQVESLLPKYYDTVVNNEKVRVVAVPLLHEFDDKAIVVQVGETRRNTHALAEDIVLAIVAPQLALMIMAGIAINRGVTVGLRPLVRLARTIEKRSSDDLTPLPSADVREECLPLLHAFNDMLVRLKSAAEAHKRFVADAAHQLRTPLAVLRLQLEQAMRAEDPQARNALLEQLLTSIERTARLSSQLLLLARAEPSAVSDTLKPVDLCAVAFDVGSQWVTQALHSGADLGLATPENPVWVAGEPVMLGELINNLVDNALRYGGRNITLRVVEKADWAELAVEDDGAGVAMEERERIFERFHRSPGSAGGGSGLGLAIVREIARGFGAEVNYRTGDQGGACFYVRFRKLPAA